MPYVAVGCPIDPLRKVSEGVNLEVLGKDILRFYLFCRLSLPALGQYWLGAGR